MKICIVGAGWIGCHLAYKLNKYHDVKIFDSEGIFSGSSFKNQNRLHLGFHYARSSLTRELCLSTFDKFLNDYKSVVTNIKKNIYSIPTYESIIDFQTYISIFNKEIFSYDTVNVPELNGIDGSISVKEKYIDPLKSKVFFEKKLKNNIEHCHITEKKLEPLKKENDLVINCTNNVLNPVGNNYFYELCLILKYKKTKKTSFDALTLVDGKLFSIYPYKNNTFTLSNVEYTPIKTFKRYSDLLKYKNNFKIDEKTIAKFENSVLHFYKNFKNDFKFNGFFLSSKTKNYNNSANRNPIIFNNDNLISCYTGKIQGIYQIENYILDLIK